jgi:hypothetical protein
MRISIRHLRLVHKVNRGGPVALLAAFALLAWALAPLEAPPQRSASIAEAFRSVPYSVGRWYGVDVPLPAVASELLRPTAVLSRRFRELGGARAAIVGLVHCADLRDMMGHHPPNCYPASGWILEPEEGDRVEIRIGGAPETARSYRFHRVDAAGLRDEVTVLGIFLLPDGRCVCDEAAVASRVGSRSLSAQGLAQLQVVVEGWAPQEEIADIADQLLGVLPVELLAALGREETGRAPGARILGGDQDEVEP